MAFCRRCGDIVFGARCKCGGSAVAPVVNWSVGEDGSKQDRWSKTYVTKENVQESSNVNSIQPILTGSNNVPKRPNRLTNAGNIAAVSLSSHVSAHIRSATSSRPSSPLKYTNTGLGSQSDEANAQEGILPNPHTSELAKVYGSVLQPKDTLSSFTCAICSTPFPPDATIYPDPSHVNASGVDISAGQSSTRFLCRPCFTTHGGSRGDCDSCHRAVLILKSDGGFVENSGRVWHKKCFDCDGCGKNIGDHPMVDLLGRPSCADCFDSCLKRPPRDDVFGSPKRIINNTVGNIGGSRKDAKGGEREGSPALDELEARLGIVRNENHTSPAASPIGRLHRTSLTTPTKDLPRSWQSSSTLPGSYDRPRADSASSSAHYSPASATRRSTESASPQYDSFRQSDNTKPNRSPYHRARSSDVAHEIDNSPTRVRGSRTSFGESKKPPTEDAIEEMKQRFLTGNGSPAVTPQKLSGSNHSTPRRRSRSRSRPRSSTGNTSATNTPTLRKSRDSETPSARSSSPSLRTSASSSSLRLRYQRTGETVTDIGTDIGLDSDHDMYRILPDRTGESTQPLRIRRHNTGTTSTSLTRDVTGSTSLLAEQKTGDTIYLKGDDTGNTYRPLDPQRTGDVIKSHRTGDSVGRQHTGEGRVRRHRTGDTDFESNQTGASGYSRHDNPVRRQRTGDADIPPSGRRDHTGERTRIEFGLRRDRTGDAEVESLLGPLSSMTTGDLIDLSPLPEPVSSLSRIPQRVGPRIPGRSGGDYRSSLEFGFRNGSSSTSSLTSSGYESSVSSVPDLASDFSDTTSTRSMGPSTPPSVSPPPRHHSKAPGETHKYGSGHRNITPTPRSRAKSVGHGLGLSTSQSSQDDRCEKCKLPLFSIKHSGKFVTVPEEPTSTGAAPRRYHAACFKCTVCGEVFEEKEGGHAVFVRVEEGACHVHCAPPEKITLRKNTASAITKASKIPLAATSTGNSSPPAPPKTTAYYASSSRYEPPPPTAPPANSFPVSQPRFGGSSSCPGCMKAVSPMERGVVSGPQGSKWHGGCLICGGLQAKGKRKEAGKAGCGKKLDSAAKLDAEGGVWCRECLLLLPPHLRQASAVKSPLAPMGTGSRPFSVVIPQGTGTTLARQFTGLGGGDGDVLRQLTGGGLSPTRQLSSSPTKMFDGPRPGIGRYARPKSVIGTRSTGSGEGRGMFLVRQLTGGNSSFSGNEYGL
ncbi:hypothetical protein BDW22DRAFT_1350908 [Trametopsis cervina]|nr:hypothetical protein BDW22DRAFT_1350908 [Trametopsis cervina]